jgi:hypothetical protein
MTRAKLVLFSELVRRGCNQSSALPSTRWSIVLVFVPGTWRGVRSGSCGSYQGLTPVAVRDAHISFFGTGLSLTGDWGMGCTVSCRRLVSLSPRSHSTSQRKGSVRVRCDIGFFRSLTSAARRLCEVPSCGLFRCRISSEVISISLMMKLMACS